LPKCPIPRYIYGSFTCRKSATWGRRLYFHPEGRRAEDFIALKNPDGFGRNPWSFTVFSADGVSGVKY